MQKIKIIFIVTSIIICYNMCEAWEIYDEVNNDKEYTAVCRNTIDNNKEREYNKICNKDRMKKESIQTRDQKQKNSKDIKYYDIPLPEDIQEYTIKICEEHNVEVEDIIAIMETESKFIHSVSSKNNIGGNYSIGIMQLNNNYVGWYKEITGINNFDINNIHHNILGGVLVYKNYTKHWEKKGIISKELKIMALNSYNMGISGFTKYIKKTGNISRSYDKKVLKYRNELTEVI